jgi:hypothetical protein
VDELFKALKQLCKIKTFVGTSANAVKVQVWTALIAMLLLRFLQLRARFGWPCRTCWLCCVSSCLYIVICGLGWMILSNPRPRRRKNSSN